MILFLYNIFILAYGVAIKITSLFSQKAKLWVSGRKNWKKNILKFKNDHSDKSLIWFHCSSLGEFEQARTLIDYYYKKNQHYVAVSFFSPSGFEIRKNYPQAHFVFYLPLDTKANVKFLIQILKPDLVLFTKYDLWYNLLFELKKTKTKTILFSSIFRPSQIYFYKPLNNFFKSLFETFSFIAVQNQESSRLLSTINAHSVVIPDTRFDRVEEVVNVSRETPELIRFKDNQKLLICGSTWPIDEKLIKKLLLSVDDFKVVVAPHNVNHLILEELKALYFEFNPIFLSKISDKIDSRILVVDSVGLLSSIYQYADLVYVGGGFGHAVHNTLEAAVWGKPIIVGPKNKKFKEIQDMKQLGGVFEILKQDMFVEKVSDLLKRNFAELALIGNINKQYVFSKTGGSKMLISEIENVSRETM